MCDSAHGCFTCHPSNIAPLVVTVCLSPRENVHDPGGLSMVTFDDVSFIEYSVKSSTIKKLIFFSPTGGTLVSIQIWLTMKAIKTPFTFKMISCIFQ